MNDIKNLREAFFDMTQETLAIFDKDLNFIDVNEALLQSLHLKKEEIVGKNVTEISPDIKDTDRYKLYLEVLRTGKSVIIDEVRMHPSLGNFISRINLFKLGDGLGLTAVNITDLTDAINELETFVYKSSHDMRAPIASILGLINVADIDMKDLKTAKQYLNIIKQQTERLDSILFKLLETATIRHGNKIIHFINFQNLIENVLKSLQYMEGFHEIRIEHNISVGQNFFSDKLLLTSLFQNLLDNAIKYKKENIIDAYIKITVTDDSEGIKIIVEDNGIGIINSHQEDVFKMFFRCTDKVSGSGLGLYTVNHTIKKLGGTIKLESEEKVGTIFTAYLPNEKLVTNKLISAANKKRSGGGRR